MNDIQYKGVNDSKSERGAGEGVERGWGGGGAGGQVWNTKRVIGGPESAGEVDRFD